MCSTPMCESSIATASRRVSARDFFDTGVNGICPLGSGPGSAVTAGSGRSAPPRGEPGRVIGIRRARRLRRQPRTIRGGRGPGRPAPRCAGLRRLRGAGQRLRPERCLDPGPHRVQVDPDGGQRVPVEPGEQAGPRAQPDPADDLLLDQFRRDPLGAHDRAGRRVGRDGGEQEVLAADT